MHRLNNAELLSPLEIVFLRRKVSWKSSRNYWMLAQRKLRERRER